MIMMEVEDIKTKKKRRAEDYRNEYKAKILKAQKIIRGEVDCSKLEIRTARTFIKEDRKRKDDRNKSQRERYKVNRSPAEIEYYRKKSAETLKKLSVADKEYIALQRKQYDKKRHEQKKKEKHALEIQKEREKLDLEIQKHNLDLKAIYSKMETAYESKDIFYARIKEEADDDKKFLELGYNLEDSKAWIQETLYNYGRTELLPFLLDKCNGKE